MSRYSLYLQKTFDFSPAQAEEIILAMKKPIGKSIRVNTRKITLEDFRLHAKEQGWTLTDTDIPEVFLIDRADTTLALGKTIEHAAGWFYIQEVAAAHPPYLLKEEIINNKEESRNIVIKNSENAPLIKGGRGDLTNGTEEKNDNLDSTSRSPPQADHLAGMTGTILDMCAAPGGKTTQLADYFPEALIIANEVNRTRTPQLFDNLDRMGYDNIAVVSCDGRFFQNFPDFFDVVLLDAPCSGEGTAFRDDAVIDHWHEKNIDRIAKLQKQLMETAEAVTAPHGVLSYSTCTLNTMENEEVIESRLQEEKPQLLELFRKRFWPHIEHTGGFFAAIFQKTSKEAHHNYPILAAQGQKNLIVTPATKGEREIVERFISKHLKSKLKDGFLYLTKDGVYFNQRNLGPLAEHFFFVHAGARIGTIKGNTFTPVHHLWWCIQDRGAITEIILNPSQCQELSQKKYCTTQNDEGYYGVRHGKGVVGIGSIQKGKLFLSL